MKPTHSTSTASAALHIADIDIEDMGCEGFEGCEKVHYGVYGGREYEKKGGVMGIT